MSCNTRLAFRKISRRPALNVWTMHSANFACIVSNSMISVGRAADLPLTRMLNSSPARSCAWVNACMNTRTHNRTDRCQLRNPPARPWVEHGPFIVDDESGELNRPFQSDDLDAMLDEDWIPEDWSDEFFD